jgi:hypothetical protein
VEFGPINHGEILNPKIKILKNDADKKICETGNLHIDFKRGGSNYKTVYPRTSDEMYRIGSNEQEIRDNDIYYFNPENINDRCPPLPPNISNLLFSENCTNDTDCAKMKWGKQEGIRNLNRVNQDCENLKNQETDIIKEKIIQMFNRLRNKSNYPQYATAMNSPEEQNRIKNELDSDKTILIQKYRDIAIEQLKQDNPTLFPSDNYPWNNKITYKFTCRNDTTNTNSDPILFDNISSNDVSKINPIMKIIKPINQNFCNTGILNISSTVTSRDNTNKRQFERISVSGLNSNDDLSGDLPEYNPDRHKMFWDTTDYSRN